MPTKKMNKGKTLSYAESKNFKPFNWLHFLENVKITDTNQIQAAFKLAMAWPTCAVGNMCSVIPRQSDGAPVDWGLRTQGALFGALMYELKQATKEKNDAVFDYQLERCIETFHCIEKTSAELIKIINNNNKHHYT